VSALRTLEETSFPVVDIIPQPHLSFTKLENLTPTYELPVVLVPPAVIEIKDDSDLRSAPKPRELPTVYLRVFETEVCSRLACLLLPRYSLFPQPTIDSATPEGYLLRSTWTDMMDIYEISRKEAARVLLDSARWFKPGTFRPKPGTAPPPQPDDPPPAGYQLELSVMEVSGLTHPVFDIYSLFISIRRLSLPTCWSCRPRNTSRSTTARS
jgi:nuclear cap-binding protein subunit 1